MDLVGTFIFKHFDREAHDRTAQSGLKWPLIRFAEVLLIYAEAPNEVSGPAAAARDAQKRIRGRAGLRSSRNKKYETYLNFR